MEKSAAARLRGAKQKESHTNHQYYHPWTPQSEMLGKGLGTETQAQEVNSGEKNSVGNVVAA